MIKAYENPLVSLNTAGRLLHPYESEGGTPGGRCLIGPSGPGPTDEKQIDSDHSNYRFFQPGSIDGRMFITKSLMDDPTQ